MALEIDEAKSLASTFIVQLYDSRSNRAASCEQLNKLVFRHLWIDILDIQVREL
jgi:hypothetical protein